MTRFEQWKPVLAMPIVNCCLAVVNILLKKVLNDGISQLLIVTYRQTISTMFLTPIAYFGERNSRNSLTGSVICGLFFSSLIGTTLTQYFFLAGLKYTSSTYSCAFINIAPVITFALALAFRLERVKLTQVSGKAKVLGTSIGIGGSLVLALYKGIPLINIHSANNSSSSQVNRAQKAAGNHGANKDWAVGSLFLFGGSLTWSSWFIIQDRIAKKFPFEYTSTSILSFFSAIQSAILFSILDRNVSHWILKKPLEITSILYAGIVGSGLATVVMSWCVKRRGPVFTSAFSPLIQMFVAVFDVFSLHEQINLGSILGSVIVIVGMYILLWGKSKESVVHRRECDSNKINDVPTAGGKDTDCNLSLPDTLPVAVSTSTHP